MEKTTKPRLLSTLELEPGQLVRVDDQVLIVSYLDKAENEWTVVFLDPGDPLGVGVDHLREPMWEPVL